MHIDKQYLKWSVAINLSELKVIVIKNDVMEFIIYSLMKIIFFYK